MSITLHKNVRNKPKPRCLKGGGGFAVYGASLSAPAFANRLDAMKLLH